MIDDAAILDDLRRGSPAAFDRVYAAYGKRIFTFLLRLSGRRDVAEDLAQETWLKFAKHARTLREDTRLGPFLFTVARNAFISYRRWALLDLSRFVVVGFESLAPDASPADQHEQAHAIRVLEVALQKLPVAAREVLILVAVEGLEPQEAATILGIKPEALRQRLSRARAQLAEKMRRLDNSGDIA